MKLERAPKEDEVDWAYVERVHSGEHPQPKRRPTPSEVAWLVNRGWTRNEVALRFFWSNAWVNSRLEKAKVAA